MATYAKLTDCNNDLNQWQSQDLLLNKSIQPPVVKYILNDLGKPRSLIYLTTSASRLIFQ